MPSFNRLSSETSPYLLQHATNPVDWYPWGDEAFAKAKEENKLMLISIGYSSCHWCHVMEKEAFSDQQVAEFMNENYVCVKVDREERPDVDQIYMNAVQIITRSGGWPLNCFVLPDGKPVFGGTYFTREKWLDIIKSLHYTWRTDEKKVLDVADELTNGIANTEFISSKHSHDDLTPNCLAEYVDNWKKHFDNRFGANKGAPKFPMPGSLGFLLDFSWVYKDESIRQHVKLSLEKMSQGGIYDHLGGGFFRYSVDEHWHVPHFEKMLYDNAQLISLYTKGYKHFETEAYRSVVYQTIDFLRREMLSPEGGFYSAIDADSEGEEGKYYTFTKGEIDNILGANTELFSIAYGVTASGTHLGKNVLRIAASLNETACVIGAEVGYVEQKIKKSKEKLLNFRGVRVRPITDDKQLLAWNALTISALAEAYITFSDKRFLTLALNASSFVEDKLVLPDGSLQRVYCKGKTSVSGFLDDYAFLIQAYIGLYKATFDEEWLLKAKKLMEITTQKFFDNSSGMFFYTTPSHDNIIVRKMELTDGVIPSSGSVMAQNLVEMGLYFSNQDYMEMANQMRSNISSQMKMGGPFIYNWASGSLNSLIGPAELSASGLSNSNTLLDVGKQCKHPHFVPLLINSSSQLPIAKQPLEDGDLKLCVGKTCQKPSSNPKQIIEAINSAKLI